MVRRAFLKKRVPALLPGSGIVHCTLLGGFLMSTMQPPLSILTTASRSVICDRSSTPSSLSGDLCAPWCCALTSFGCGPEVEATQLHVSPLDLTSLAHVFGTLVSTYLGVARLIAWLTDGQIAVLWFGVTSALEVGSRAVAVWQSRSILYTVNGCLIFVVKRSIFQSMIYT